MSDTSNSLVDQTKKIGELFGNLKGIAVIAIGGIAAVWAFFDKIDAKFDDVDDIKRQIGEISSNLVLINNAVQKSTEKVERLTENTLGVDRRVTVAESKLEALEQKFSKAASVNEQVPFRFIDSTNNNVTEGKPGDYVKVTVNYDKFRSDCTPKITRVILDSSGILHDVTARATIPDNVVAPLGTNQTGNFLVKLPEAAVLKPGSARYQSRIQYICGDGGAFFVTSPWLTFNVLDTKRR